MERTAKYLCQKIGLITCLSGSLLAIFLTPARASNTAQITVTATVTATCSLAVQSEVNLGSIPVTVFEGVSAGGEIVGYDANFTVTTTCSGTNRYTLTFAPTVVNYNCATASSGGIGYCLYHNNEKIMLAGTRSVTGEGGSQSIRVVPLRLASLPVVGTHSALLTVTINPL